MKRLLIGFLLGLALGSVAQGQDTKNIKSVTQSFGEGGTVWLKLASGNYSVRAGASDNVLVQWVPEDSCLISFRLPGEKQTCRLVHM